MPRGEFGTPMEQGKLFSLKLGRRSDIHEMCSRVLSGESTVDSEVTENPFLVVQYGRRLREEQALLIPERTRAPEVYWLCGPPGTGKSHYAKQAALAAGGAIYYKSPWTK